MAIREVAVHPELRAMLARLNEDPDLSPSERANLRERIALDYRFSAYLQEAEQAGTDEKLHSLVAANIQAELDELDALAGSEVTTEWDAAYQDLRQFYGDPMIDAINDAIDTMQDPEAP
jgi:hypothetical protein